jgi:cell wall-associated NlpC family hydrolase
MDFRFPVIFILLVLVVLAVFSGCTSASGTNSITTPLPNTSVTSEQAMSAKIQQDVPTTMTIAEQGNLTQQSVVKSDNVVLLEANRILLNMKSTEYVNLPYTIDDAAGIYKFDCRGFVDQVLKNADPVVYQKIGRGVSPIPLPMYVDYFNKLDSKTPNADGWIKVAHPIDLKPGDICFWRPPVPGHMFIIIGKPQENPVRNEEVLVRIIDSAPGSHSDDSRTGSAYPTGLGAGVLGIIVDTDRNPIRYNWRGGMVQSPETAGPGRKIWEENATILCGRLNR